MHQSVATIDSPQFLNLQPLDINPLMSECEIKVLYVGANRNRTFISKEVATEIGKTLRGAPIVGYYRDTKGDFTDHGERITIDDEGFKFDCLTFPYGFVAPNAKVWFQTFQDYDDMGNMVVHEYLMTTGYLWTSQFPESSLPVNEGRPQSMQFQKDSVKGLWEKNIENGIDFFIINDAIVQKLCILGDDVEPCFEGSSITGVTTVNSSYTLDNNFRHTLYSMMQDLKEALDKGEQQMDNFENVTPVVEEDKTIFTETKDIEDEVNTVYVSKEEEEKDDDKKEDKDEKSASDDTKNEDDKDQDDDKEDTKKYELLEGDYNSLKSSYGSLEESFNTLKQQYQLLENQCNELMNFKKECDNKAKDELIAEFYMLSNEDKADVINNKQKYTLSEIKAKLAVICFDKKISFSLNDTTEENGKEQSIITYSLDDKDSSLPDWIKAVKEQEGIL